MRDRVKDCGEQPPAQDSPWWNWPSCSSLARERTVEVRPKGAASDTCMALSLYACQMCQVWADSCVWRCLCHLSVWCDQWAGRRRYWLCVSATGHCRLSTCTGPFRRCTALNGAAMGEGEEARVREKYIYIYNTLWLVLHLRWCWPMKKFAN